jgi:hypothetical protein
MEKLQLIIMNFQLKRGFTLYGEIMEMMQKWNQFVYKNRQSHGSVSKKLGSSKKDFSICSLNKSMQEINLENSESMQEKEKEFFRGNVLFCFKDENSSKNTEIYLKYLYKVFLQEPVDFLKQKKVILSCLYLTLIMKFKSRDFLINKVRSSLYLT